MIPTSQQPPEPAWERIKKTTKLALSRLDQIDIDKYNFAKDHISICGWNAQEYILSYLFDYKQLDYLQVAKLAGVDKNTSNAWMNNRIKGRVWKIAHDTIEHLRRTMRRKFPDFKNNEPSDVQVHIAGVLTLINFARREFFPESEQIVKNYLVDTNFIGILQYLIDNDIIKPWRVPMDAEAFFGAVRKFSCTRCLNDGQIADYYHDWFGPYLVTRTMAADLFESDVIPYPELKSAIIGEI